MDLQQNLAPKDHTLFAPTDLKFFFMPIVWTSAATFPAKPGCVVLELLFLFLIGNQVGMGEGAFISSLELHDEMILSLAASLENNLDSEKKNKCKFLGV